jgi:polysaccharide export outer membrane protein
MFSRALCLSLVVCISAELAFAAPAAAQGAPLTPGITATPPPATTAIAPAPADAAPVPPAPGPARETDRDYRLGPRDKVRIIVYGEPTLSGEFFVSGSGQISFPLVGDIDATNSTVAEFQTRLETALRQGYLKEPRVSAEVLTYRPFYILGEINKPGEYPYSNGLNVLNAVATAGGFTYRAQKRSVRIRRASGAEERSYPLTSDLLVSPGDTIRITERLF